ncbi:CoA ester lyase [Ottowia sp.]|uniref:HpcH/HpaI aldolase/citrate lyase family protein n=1 Tax=Ottowia sp. TaxID=1898956 RepID=UPI002B6826A9|nr:CoA ester lyase [Ottowia sp.]HOB66987.1 CoA ester lyase [Ottowia sp.]HPZ58100.1 CoA ester lyase [Ottowia sp.]HQD47736.1 CoA ester lyase [Ottowia sp.]
MNPSSAVAFLFVPGNRPERLAKALASGAGAVIVDWEDAVAPPDKAAARALLAQALSSVPAADRARLLLRINAAGTPWHADDVAALPPFAAQGLKAVVVPKAESAAALAPVAAALGAGGALLPLIESAAGLEAVRQIAAAPQVARLLFGHLDFQADLGLACGPDEAELMPVRLQIVLASRLAGLAPPVDGVTTDTQDRALVQAHAARALRGGFGGKLCIHPAQVAAVHAAFAPSPAQIDWARRVVDGFDAAQGGVFSIDGRMVDAPVVQLARQTLRRAAPAGVTQVTADKG